MKKEEKKKISVENSQCVRGFFSRKGGQRKNGKSSKIFGENRAPQPEGGGRQRRVRADNARGVGGVIKGSPPEPRRRRRAGRSAYIFFGGWRTTTTKISARFQSGTENKTRREEKKLFPSEIENLRCSEKEAI